MFQPPTTFRIAPALIAGLLTATAGVPVALAASTHYLVNGEAGTAGGTSLLDNSTFELKLTFDEPTPSDPDRSTFAGPTLTYVASAWSLAFFDDAGVVVEYDQTTLPEALGFAELAGQVTGLDDGETTIRVGVDNNITSDTGSLTGSLLEAEFFAPTLVDAFFTDRLIDLPDDLAFVSGSTFSDADTQNLPITTASLAAVSLDDELTPSPGVDSSETDNSPAAVPSPTAAAAGLFLLTGLLTRATRRR